eukprot:7287067-Prymnesium_polylepis.1
MRSGEQPLAEAAQEAKGQVETQGAATLRGQATPGMCVRSLDTRTCSHQRCAALVPTRPYSLRPSARQSTWRRLLTCAYIVDGGSCTESRSSSAD